MSSFEPDVSDPDPLEDADLSDVVPFVLSEREAPASGRTLEIHQAWGTTLLATRQFPAGHGDVRIGLESGHHWRFLGIDMGFVPRPVGALLPWVAPLWSEVEGTWRSDFVVDADDLPGAEGWTLFEVGPDGEAAAHVVVGWAGFLEQGGEQRPFAALVAAGEATLTPEGALRIPIPPSARLGVEVGGSVFFARRVTPAPRVGRASAEAPDHLFSGALAVGACLFLAMVATTWMVPPTHHDATRQVPPELVELLLGLPTADTVASVKAKQEESGAKAKDREGKTGRDDGDRKVAKRQARSDQRDRAVAERAGLLGAIDDDAVAAVLGSSSLSDDLRSRVGGLIGSAGNQLGTGGLGGRGPGLGGGGEADSLGGIHTHGIGDGARDYGVPGGGGGKEEGVIGSSPREAVVLGPLDRSLIDEVVKRNLPSLKYCYQRQLNRSSELGGKVVMKFTISGDGSVSAASTRSSTLASPAVEGCLAERFLRMRFPAPQAGGTVIVSYPFLFSQGS